MLGEKLKRMRIQRGFTINDLAKKTNLDKNTIVRLEQNKGKPSFNSLIKLSEALKIGIEYLTNPEIIENEDYIIRKYSFNGLKYLEQGGIDIGDLKAKLPNGILNSAIIRIPPKTSSKERSHPGEELLVCLKGQIGIQVGNITDVLDEGNAIMFFASEHHRYFNPNANSIVAHALTVWIEANEGNFNIQYY